GPRFPRLSRWHFHQHQALKARGVVNTGAEQVIRLGSENDPSLLLNPLGRRKHLLHVEYKADLISARKFPAVEERHGNGDVARVAVGGLLPGALDLPVVIMLPGPKRQIILVGEKARLHLLEIAWAEPKRVFIACRADGQEVLLESCFQGDLEPVSFLDATLEEGLIELGVSNVHSHIEVVIVPP